MVTPGTAVERGLVDPEAGLAPDVEVADGLGRRLVFAVGAILMAAAFAAAAFGEGPADLEAVAILVAFVPGDLHTGGQVDLDRDAGHGISPRWSRWADQHAILKNSLGIRDRDDNPGERLRPSTKKVLGLAP